jgi:hypothetical protein
MALSQERQARRRRHFGTRRIDRRVASRIGRRRLVRMQQEPSIKQWIIASIRRILAGQPFTRTDWEAQPRAGWDEIEPKRRLFLLRLDKHPAYFAWTALRWWADDADIRAKDPKYGEMRRSKLQELLEEIDPVGRTEDPAR